MRVDHCNDKDFPTDREMSKYTYIFANLKNIKGMIMTVTKKIVLLGDSSVGKTSLIRRYVFNIFDDAYIVTIGSKVSKKQFTISKDGQSTQLNLMIWDVIGREGYTSIHTRTFAGVHGAILVADLTRKETLISLERYWIPILFKIVDYIPLVFACNKSDLTSSVDFDFDELQKVAGRYNNGFEDTLPEHLTTSYLTSAKTGDNVDVTFKSLGHMLLSEKITEDPIKELFESVKAMGVSIQLDKDSNIGALDGILADFCENFDDDKLAMTLIRQEIYRAGVDVKNPTKESIFKVVEYFAEVESEYLDADQVATNKGKRMNWVRRVK